MNKNIVLVFLLLFLLILVSYIENKISIFIWGGVWLMFGSLIIGFSLKSYIKNSLSVYYSFFFIYLLYSFFCNIFYVKDPSSDFFYAQDTLHFYSYSNMLGNLGSIKEVFRVSFSDFISSDWKGFAFLSGLVSYISNLIDENGIMVQKLIVVFFSSIILPYLYAILTHFFREKESIRLTFIYGLFSYSLFYSAILVRDVPIGFFFIILTYLFFIKYSLNKIPIFLLISFLTFLFRPEHGIFSLLFLLLYLFIYLEEKNNRYKYFLILPALIILLVFFGDLKNVLFDTVGVTTDRYLEHSMESAQSSSLGLLLLKLPWGIRHVSAGLFSQTLPFPFYSGLSINGFGFVPLSIAAIFWFIIWVIILQVIRYKNRIRIEYRLWLLFFISTLLVLGTSVNADTRRVMAVYPIFFVFGMNIYRSFNKQQQKRIIGLALGSYIVLLLIYSFIKS